MILPPRATASAQPCEPGLVRSAKSSSTALVAFSCSLATAQEANKITNAEIAQIALNKAVLAMCGCSFFERSRVYSHLSLGATAFRGADPLLSCRRAHSDYS